MGRFGVRFVAGEFVKALCARGLARKWLVGAEPMLYGGLCACGVRPGSLRIRRFWARRCRTRPPCRLLGLPLHIASAEFPSMWIVPA